MMEVMFRPTQITGYEEKVEFEINGLSKKSINVKGEGVPMKVVLRERERERERESNKAE